MSRYTRFALLLTLAFHSGEAGDSNLDVFTDCAAAREGNCPVTSREHSVVQTQEEDLIAQTEPEEAISALSLLQTSSVSYQRLRADSGHCKLKFLHIPKNMGGTIERFSMNEHTNMLLYGLHEVRPNEYGIPGVGECDSPSCIPVHTPPSFLPSPNRYTVARSLGDEVFCITRNPYERAISLYTHSLANDVLNGLTVDPEDCTKEALNEKWQYWMRRYLHGHRSINQLPRDRDCMLYPQSLLIYGPDEDKQWCQHILRMDEMPGAFNQLLNESGCDKQFVDDGRYDSHTELHNVCPTLSVTDLTHETIAMLNVHYRKDFELLGYELQ